MNKKIKFINLNGLDSTSGTEFEYELGETIRVGSTDKYYKCVDIVVGDNEKVYCFKEGKTVYDFSW